MSAALFISRASSKARCLQNPVGMLWQSGGRSRLAGTTKCVAPVCWLAIQKYLCTVTTTSPDFSSSPDDSLPESLYITLEEYQQLLSDGVLRSLYPPPEPSGKLTMVDNRGGKLLEDIEVSDQLKKVEGAITDDQDNDLKLMNMNFEDLCDEDKILVFFKRIWMKWNEEMEEKRSGVGQDSIQVFEWYARHPDILFNLCRKKALQDDYRQALISVIDCCMKQDFTSAIAYLHRADTDILACCDDVACSVGTVDRLVHMFFMQKTGLSKATR